MAGDNPQTTALLWPEPPELAHMSGQFKLGYRQAKAEAAEWLKTIKEKIAKRIDELPDDASQEEFIDTVYHPLLEMFEGMNP